jgi:hypothetical protein
MARLTFCGSMDHALNRRAFLGAAGVTLAADMTQLSALAAPDVNAALKKAQKRIILLWLAGGLVLLVFSLKKNLLDQLASFVGIAYAPSLLLLGAILLGFLLSMHFSVALSRLAEQNKRLAQELAILRLSVEELRNEAGEDAR